MCEKVQNCALSMSSFSNKQTAETKSDNCRQENGNVVIWQVPGKILKLWDKTACRKSDIFNKDSNQYSLDITVRIDFYQ